MLSSEGVILLMLFPHPTHPPDFGGDPDGEEGGEYGPLGGGVQPGGVSVKGPGPVGVIILV